MDKEKTYIELDDALQQLVNYITSGEFNRNLNFLSDTERHAYMAALGMAGCLISARCKKFIIKDNNNE